MRNIVKGVALAAALALWAGPAAAADNLIPGKITVLKPGKLAKFVSKGTFTLPTGPDAPTTIGGSLAYFDTIFGAGSETHLLPQVRWTGLGNPPGSKGYKYKGSGGAGDACKVVLIKTTVIKGVCKGTDVTITPPLVGDLGVVLSCGLGTRYCTAFGGTNIKNQAGLLKRKDADPPLSCPTPGLQTTTTTSSSSTSTSTSSTTSSTTAPSCCGAERYTLTSTVGTLQVDSLPPFTFPANVTTVMDTSAPTVGLPTCEHRVIVPAAGFVVPTYDIALLNYCSSVTAVGCESGGGDGKGKLWDGGGSPGLAMTGIRKDADTADGVCDPTVIVSGTCAVSGGSCLNPPDCAGNLCSSGTCTLSGGSCTTTPQCPVNSCSSTCSTNPGGAGANTLGKIQATRSLGPGGGVRSVLDIPVHSVTWSDSVCQPAITPGCCIGANYNPSDGDTLATEFDFILSPTTGSATGAFTDMNGDGCKRAGAGFLGGSDGPTTLTGSAAAGPCCTVGQASTVVSVGVGLSGAGPLFDLGFRSTIPNTVVSCGVPAAGDCTITTDTCFGSPGGAFLE